ncbi:MAG: hypothetical protein K9I94_03605 [Bacteroidales bacterium]|nr:hypothetical protein [Bacteroidales bacterium]
MRKALLFTLVLNLVTLGAFAQSKIAHTLHQQFASRIYFLNPDGSTITYYEYENYRLEDLTLVDNELYVADAFAPMVLKVDMETGALEQFIFDLWPTYYYGLASDGEYFYVEDWGTLYKYDMNGDEVGTLDFDETIYGMACDSVHLYTIIEDDDTIRCWDLSEWPQITEVPQNSIAKPSAACRGLTYDGKHFWTAEAYDGQSGNIYRFDKEGNVQSELESPSYTGWSACYIEDTTNTGIPEYSTDQIRMYQSQRTGNLIVASELDKDLQIKVHLYDMQARRVKTYQTKLSKGQARRPIGTPQLKAGQYIYRIITGEKKVYGGKMTVK